MIFWILVKNFFFSLYIIIPLKVTLGISGLVFFLCTSLISDFQSKFEFVTFTYSSFGCLQMPIHLAIGSFAFPCSNRLGIGIWLWMYTYISLFSASGALCRVFVGCA